MYKNVHSIIILNNLKVEITKIPIETGRVESHDILLSEVL